MTIIFEDFFWKFFLYSIHFVNDSKLNEFMLENKKKSVEDVIFFVNYTIKLCANAIFKDFRYVRQLPI